MTISEQSGTRTVLEDLYQAFGRGDVPSVLAAFDPHIVWTEAAGGHFAGTYTGPDAVLESVFGPLAAEWDGFLVVPEEYVCSGERAVVLGTYHGQNRATGRSLQARFAHCWLLSNGRAVQFEQITDTALWRAATG
jgi:ketosteroid isomerase-like protein